MGAENAKIESAEKSAETGGHQYEYTPFYNLLKIVYGVIATLTRGGLINLILA